MLENLHSMMPLWAIFYTGFILASAAGTIMISGRKSSLYILGELLSAFFAISFFLFYYGVLAYPSSIMIVVLMLGFIFFQEIWINRELYGFLQMEDVDEGEKRFTLWFGALFLAIFLLPFFWIVSEVFKHYLLK